jgi:hypothetical protein
LLDLEKLPANFCEVLSNQNLLAPVIQRLAIGSQGL